MNTATDNDDAGLLGEVDLLATDFLARYRDGDRPTIEEYARRHPDFASMIRRIFPLVISIEKVKIDDQHAADGSATLAGRQIQQLDDFKIEREIGRGGMGIVFEARQESLGRQVAIKVLPKQSLLDDRALLQFQREAKTAAAMHHSNIVPIYGTGESDGTHYLVMQLVHGESLDKILQQLDTPMEISFVAKVAEQLADAIAYAHANGVLHRDIKPANILIEQNGTAQITDFGLARIVDEKATHTRTLSGSLRYMAPERFRGISNHQCDVYSLGLTIYEMLTGKPAFFDADPAQLLKNVAERLPKPLRSLRRTTPLDLQIIVEKAINPDPSQRYETAAALRDDLQRYSANEPIQARRMTAMQRSWRWCCRNPKLATASGVAITALVAATVASSAGYALTSAANKRTSKALRESEQTVSLALQSLDGIVESVSMPTTSTDGMTSLTFSDSEEPTSFDFPFNMSEQSATLLERVQPLYERLSQQAPSRPDIVLRMTDASLRLAQIQHQFNRTNEAFTTISRSTKLLKERGEQSELPADERQLRMARLFNAQGKLHKSKRNLQAANQSFENAVDAASQSSSNSERQLDLQLELARAHLQLGVVSPKRRFANVESETFRQSSKRHLFAAKQLLENFADNQRHATTINILRAQCHLGMSYLTDDPFACRDEWEQAVSILESGLKESPNNAPLRFELVQTLSDVLIQRRWRRPKRMVANKQLSRALDNLQTLRTRYPDTPSFSVAEVHILHKMAHLSRIQNQWPKAVDQIQRAIKTQTELLQSQPNRMAHRCWRALLYRSQAENLRQQGKYAEGKDMLEQAQADLASIDPDFAEHPFVKQTKAIIANAQRSTEQDSPIESD